MNAIKNLFTIVILLTVLVLIPASSYALVDAAVFGGYSFNNKIDGAGTDESVKGWQYGLYGHFNTGIPMLVTVGIGGFYLIAPLKGDINATKKAAGIDVYGQIDLPFLPVFPYARYGIAINEKIEIENGPTLSKNFKSHYFGLGVSRTLFTATLLKLQIFAEFLFTTSKQENSVNVKGNAINVGIKAVI
jgi:hypothetical protein